MKLPNYLSKNTEPTITSSPTPATQIHVPIQSATLCLPALLNLMLQKAALIKQPTHSLDPGVSPQPSKSLCTNMSIAPLPTGRRRNMHPIYPYTYWNSSRFNHLMVPTLSMANYTNLLQLTHSRRLILTGLTPLPITPFKTSANFLMTNQVSEFHWQSLLNLNDDLFPFHWSSEEEWSHYLVGDTILTIPVMYTGPPPSSLTYSTPMSPLLSIITWPIIQSSNKLSFISYSIGTNDAHKWQLVWVALQESLSLYPSCLQDGCFLVDFYINHPSDSQYNASNQQYWLPQYHTIGELQLPLSTMVTHLIGPSESSEDYTTWYKLLPFHKWVNLTHCNTFIHGLLEFATVNGRKTWNHISQSDWEVLRAHCDMFHNPLPHFDVPSYSWHYRPWYLVGFFSDYC